MSTTSLIIEILVIGLFTLIWIFILLIGIFGLKDITDFISQDISFITNNSAITLFILLGLLYQIGWMINFWSYRLGKFIFAKIAWRTVHGEIPIKKGYIVNTLAYLKAPKEFLTKLHENLGVVRLMRAGIINFSILGIVLISFFKLPGLVSGGICFLAVFSCYKQCKYNAEAYYSRLEELKKYSDTNKA